MCVSIAVCNVRKESEDIRVLGSFNFSSVSKEKWFIGERGGK